MGKVDFHGLPGHHDGVLAFVLPVRYQISTRLCGGDEHGVLSYQEKPRRLVRVEVKLFVFGGFGCVDEVEILTEINAALLQGMGVTPTLLF